MLRVLDIMDWMREKFGKSYAPNSRETVRRQTIHQFEQARLIDRNPDNPSRPTNSGDTNYQLTSDAARVLQAFGTRRFATACRKFIKKFGALTAAYEQSRSLVKVPVTLPDGTSVALSPGIHNELQKAIVEEFAPRFAQGSAVVYLGDTAEKRLVTATELLENLRIPELKHDKLPDVVLYDKNRDWLFLVEAVTSHGPISPKRHIELEQVLSSCSAGRVYVTAFADFSGFKQYVGEIVWESEVWIAESPDHLIHFDGKRFLGPYPRDDSD
jgi:adenine-specific DNA-methyltransferase